MLELLDLRQALMRAYDHCLTPVQEASGLNRTELDVLLFLANNPAYDTAADMVVLSMEPAPVFRNSAIFCRI